MPLYDLMLLLDPGAPTDRQEAILRDVQGLLEKSGEVKGTYDWGQRRMTFEINHRPDAAYHLYQFETEGGPGPLEQVDHSLKIMDGVLRHRIIRLKDGSPPPPTPQPDRRGGYGDYEADGAPSEAPSADAAAPSADPVADAPAEAPAADAAATDAPVAEAAAPEAPAAAEAPETEAPADAEASAPAEEAPAPEGDDGPTAA